MAVTSGQSKQKQVTHPGDTMATKQSQVHKANARVTNDTDASNSNIVEMTSNDLESNKLQSAEEQLGEKQILAVHQY